MSDMAPLSTTYSVSIPALAVGVDGLYNVTTAAWAGTLVSATYAPNAAIAGANTNSRTLNLLNGGAAGNGTTNMASLPLVSGTNLTIDHETALVNNATAANLAVAAGDAIVFQSLHVGTGIADPGGRVTLVLSRG